MKLWSLIISIAITHLLCLQDNPGFAVQAQSANPRFSHRLKTKGVPKTKGLLQTVAKEHCTEILLFQPFTCTTEKCHKVCKENEGPSNDDDQCLPRENVESPNGKSQDVSGKVSNVESWDVPPVEIEDDGYDADQEDNVQVEHKKVMAHRECLLHDEKVQRHLHMQEAMLISSQEDRRYDYKDSDFEVKSDDNSEDECCCAPKVPGA